MKPIATIILSHPAKQEFVIGKLITNNFGLSASYAFTLEFTHNAILDISSITNTTALLKLTPVHDAQELIIHGVIASCSISGNNYAYNYSIQLCSLLHNLTLKQTSRAFVNTSAIDIIKQLFNAAGWSTTDYKFHLSGDYQPLPFFVQLNQSDYDYFICLLQQQELFFYFKYDAQQTTLIITDDIKLLPNTITTVSLRQ